MERALALLATVLLAVTIPAAISARAQVVQTQDLRVTVGGELRPERLPRRGLAPIAVSVNSRISTTDASLPPELRRLRIELNRHGRLDHAGLPTCGLEEIQPGSSAHALATCRPALVGKGSFSAEITLAGAEPHPTDGRLLLFNGRRGGKQVLLGHIYSARPFATSFVIVFAVRRIAHGTYGTLLDAPLPRAMDSWGRLTGLRMTLSRRYHRRGVSHSFLSSACPTPPGVGRASFPLARTTFSFEGGANLTSVLTDTCKAR